MEKRTCVSCQSANGNLECVGCKEGLCKRCAQFVDLHTFSFLSEMPNQLEPGAYCIHCYDVKAKPEVEAYEANVDRAKNIDVFFKNQGKESRLLKRAQFPVRVDDCEDREETLLRLAFKAVLEGYDTLVTVEVNPKKLRDGTRQKAVYIGTGVPALGRKR